jgi:hypothetical protein
MVSGYQSKMIAIALSKPSNKAIFFNNTSVFREISEGSNNLRSEFTKLSTSSGSNRNFYNQYITNRDLCTTPFLVIFGKFTIVFIE